MGNLGPIEFLVVAVLVAVVVLEVTYWVIRLAVRSGVNDALRANQEWLGRQSVGSRSDPR